MIGVDLGLNVGSVTRVKKRGFDEKKRWVVIDHLVLKFTREKEDPKRIEKIAIRYVDVITKMANKKESIYIEQPVLSWQRRNPLAFQKAIELQTLIVYLLRHMAGCNYYINGVNNKSAKKAAGYGGKDKSGMIEAYRKMTGMLPGHKTQYGQETLADSFFIALAGHYAKTRD